MAIVKSNRNLAKGTLDSYNNKELIIRYQLLNKEFNDYEEDVKRQIKGYEEGIRTRDIKNKELENRVVQLEKSVAIFTTDEYKIKQVLKLYSQGKSIGTVYSYMVEQKQIDIEFEKVKSIINALDSGELDENYIEYYNEMLKVSSKELPFQEESYRIQKLRKMDEFCVLIEESMAELKQKGLDAVDIDKQNHFMMLLDKYIKVVEGSSKIMKGLNSSSVDVKVENNIADTERFEQKAVDTLLNFSGAEVTYSEVN